MSGQGKSLAARHATRYDRTIGIAEHVVQRFRERWPAGAHLSDGEIRLEIQGQIQRARKKGHVVKGLDGEYYPVTYMGVDGFAVIAQSGHVVTLMMDDGRIEVVSEMMKLKRSTY